MTEPADRRVRRTRRALHEALIGLMLERGYARVTVQDILDRADVGRSTFYAHFRNKDDLLVGSSTDYLRRAVADTVSPTAPPLAPAHTLLRLAAAHPDLYRALIGPKSGAVPLRATRQMIAGMLGDHLRDRLDLPDDDFADTVAFLSWGLLGLIDAVIDPRRPTPPDVAFRRLEALTGPGLAARMRR
ncbi:TetR/AcrR family transcriptional regulator [Nocardia blacklockiae]|uniref:TetR/AcrR family transcriptional regulator n=1 Tax=Nocardia blacklockiae TaxID=480036 RepID=UPI0018944A4E|nr:helix-turn-helix domain-containing protein [Nocardia blacklockiae]MBF6171744.1 helix-turn-helix transcriptional regulator [Nocardia blacklockiae]